MDIEGKMGAVEREIMLKSALEHPPSSARDRLQTRPEQPVVHDEKVYSAIDCRINRVRGSIDRGANFGSRAGVFDLQTIERIWPIFDLPNAKEIAAIIYQLMEL